MNAGLLSVILVKNGSRGDRLLFKYPYRNKLEQNKLKGMKKCKFSLAQNSNLKENSTIRNISSENLSELPDEVISHLFAVNNKLCGAKFEMKVNDVRFVGHPINLEEHKLSHNKSKKKESSITVFHVIFALKSSMNYDLVHCFHDISKRLSVALKFEEKRCQFLYRQAKIMLNAYDEASQLPESAEQSGFDLCLCQSLAAQHLKGVFEGLHNYGEVNILVNNWIHLSFCLPRRIINGYGRQNLLSNEVLMNSLKNVKPYQTFLLLVDKEMLLDSLAPDSSPALRRLLHVHNPMSPFYTLAANADLTLKQVILLAGHLIYWGKATIVYPVCNTNMYVVPFKTPLSKKYADEFLEEFPDGSYYETVADFSLPISFCDKANPMSLPTEMQQENMKLLWLLKHGLLQQLHIYVYIIRLTNRIKMDNRFSSRGHLETVAEIQTDDVTDIIDLESEMSLNGSMMAKSFSEVNGTMEESLSSTGSSDENSVHNLLNTYLTPIEKEFLMKMEAAKNPDDLKNFARLCMYFRGEHHIEEIMYRSNVNRSEVIEVMEKFRPILLTVQHADPSIFLSSEFVR